MSVVRKLTFQQDILEWLAHQKAPVAVLRKERYKIEKGFVAYGKDFIQYFRKTPHADDKSVEMPDAKSSAKAMDQFYESQGLIKRMKWKRVTWDEEADYVSFSKRVLDNDSMFKRTPAFSFLSIHVIKDPYTTNLISIPAGEKIIEAGSLTNWLLQESDRKEVELYPLRNVSERRSAFSVDWSSGSVKIIDSASAQEMLTFLSTVAPRLQAVQLQMEAQQLLQTTNVEKVRVRVGATLRFNAFNTSFWDDPKRKTDPTFVNPDELDQFLNGMLKSPLLYRWFIKGQEIRVMPPGRPFYVDIEKKELQVPANFAEYNWLPAHARFEAVEKVMNTFRKFWWLWFSIGMILVGDAELL